MSHKSILGSIWGTRFATAAVFGLLVCTATAASATAQEAAPPAQLGGAASVPQLPAKTQAKLDKARAALKAARETADAPGEARALADIGDLFFDASDYTRALESYNLALPILEKQDDHADEADTLAKIAMTFDGLREYTKELESLNKALPIYQAQNDRAKEAATLESIGEVYNDLKDKDKALEYFNRALPIFTVIGDHSDEADTLTNIGDVYSAEDDNEKALDFYNRALPLYSSEEESTDKADTLKKIGDIYAGTDGVEKYMAPDSYNQALAIYKAKADHLDEADTLLDLGRCKYDLGDNQGALDSFNKSLPIYKSLANRLGQARVEANIGKVYVRLGKGREALDFYNQALPVFHAEGERYDEAGILTMIGDAWSSLDQNQKAIEFYNQALAILHAEGKSLAEGGTLMTIGNKYSELGLKGNQRALEIYNQALPIFHAQGQRLFEAMTLLDIGNVSFNLGELEKSRDFSSQALTLFESVNARKFEAMALAGVGEALNELGEKEKALDSYNRALEINRDPDLRNQLGEAQNLNSIGIVYMNLGDVRKALDFYNQALELRKTVKDRSGEGLELNNIAIAYADLGENRKALNFYNQALQIGTEVHDRGDQARALNNMANVYLTLGDKEKALDLYNQALEIRRAVNDLIGQVTTLNNIGLIYAGRGNTQRALDYHNQALPIATSMRNPSSEVDTFSDLMSAHRAQHPELAIFYGKQAVNLLQQMRSNIQGLDKELQKTFLVSNQDCYHKLADLLIAQGRLPEAQQVLDMMKLSEFEQFTRSPRPDSSQTASMTAREKTAEDAYQKASEHLFQVADAESTLRSSLDEQPNPTAEDKKKLADLDSQLATATRAFNNLLAALPSMLPNEGQKADAENMTRKIPGLANLLGGIAEPGTVALYTLVTDHYYRVIVISGDGWTDEKHTEIPIGVLRQQVARFKELLSKKPGQESGERTPAETAEMMELAAKLYAALIAPVAPDLDALHAHTLVWELDDALHYLPLGALYNTAAKQFVAEKYANVIITPTDQLNLQARPDLTGARVLALGLSRPDFDQNFGKLPNVPGELAAIVRDPSKPGTDGVLPGSEWLDLEFTEARFIGELKGAQTGKGKGQPYKIVHIASHFNADPAGDYIKSFLLLAGQNAPLDQNGYGFHLTLDDLSTQPEMHRIFKGVDLLTLSACQTAVTVQNGNGHEIDGLGGVAETQGAGAVMASLWSVDDQSTSKLMARFYKLWTDPTATLTKVEALRQAQLEMLGKSTEAFADPYYWAPFILMGNWK